MAVPVSPPSPNRGGFALLHTGFPMKENALDVLMYLFHNAMEVDVEVDVDRDRDFVQWELLAAGFPLREIDQAFAWLDSLVDRPPAALPVNPRACRIYVPAELARLDVECRGFLLFLEQSGILDPETRERVIDRAMALDADEIDVYELKWIILMILFNQPGQEEACAWMEDLVFDAAPGYLH
jgi:Smg protein